jgi:hypothetical protein
LDLVLIKEKKLFVNMEDEINLAKNKLDEKKKREKLLIEENQQKINDNASKNTILVNKEPPKKNVFAKLKSYNRDSIKTATYALDPKKSSNIPKNTVVNTKIDENVILKENANRYSYQGRMTNFSFLKKVDRKEVDKNYTLSFAEFKKRRIEQ